MPPDWGSHRQRRSRASPAISAQVGFRVSVTNRKLSTAILPRFGVALLAFRWHSYVLSVFQRFAQVRSFAHRLAQMHIRCITIQIGTPPVQQPHYPAWTWREAAKTRSFFCTPKHSLRFITPRTPFQPSDIHDCGEYAYRPPKTCAIVSTIISWCFGLGSAVLHRLAYLSSF